MHPRPNQRVLVTGGAGFIGSALVERLVAQGRAVCTVDALTYAGDLANLSGVLDAATHEFRRLDILDAEGLDAAFAAFRPDAVLHLAAESHVDRSIADPARFVETNVLGTQRLLEAALRHWRGLPASEQAGFAFLQVSTDEVYGSLGETGRFSEESPCRPNSPYAASKAAADMLCRAYWRTYGLPALICHGCNAYGPRQHAEKLMPVVIRAAAARRPVPIYGAGRNVREWLFVEDFAEALIAAAERGRIGERYNLGSGVESANLDLATALCDLIDAQAPGSGATPKVGAAPIFDATPRRALIEHVADRAGHDFRYALDSTKAARELGWRARTPLEEGLRRTVLWHLARAAE